MAGAIRGTIGGRTHHTSPVLSGQYGEGTTRRTSRIRATVGVLSHRSGDIQVGSPDERLMGYVYDDKWISNSDVE